MKSAARQAFGVGGAPVYSRDSNDESESGEAERSLLSSVSDDELCAELCDRGLPDLEERLSDDGEAADMVGD